MSRSLRCGSIASSRHITGVRKNQYQRSKTLAVSQAVSAIVDGTTLQDLCERAKAVGGRPVTSGEPGHDPTGD